MDKSKLRKKSANQIILYQNAIIKQHQIEFDNLKKQHYQLTQEKRKIIKSLSFKIGSFFTFPIRMLFNLFFTKKTVENPIKATCDSAVSISGYLEIVGWTISNCKIDRVEVYLSDEMIGITGINQFRDDVHRAFPDDNYSTTCGFSFRKKIITDCDIVTLKVYDQHTNMVTLEKVIIPSFGDMSLNTQYQIFLDQMRPLNIKIANKTIERFNHKPLISIVVPIYNVSPKWLKKCIDSVINQFYGNWQLCLYDDASNKPRTIQYLRKLEGKDKRIKIKFGPKNIGIALATNQAIMMSEGEFIGLLDHDDTLTSDALCRVVEEINENPEIDFLYSDEDKIDNDGSYIDPHFKSDFNLDTLLSWNYMCHFAVIRKSIGDKIGWFRQGYDGSQDYDLFLRIVSVTNKIKHIPKVLYHWRKTKLSTAVAIDNKSYAIEASKKALKDYLLRHNIDATVEDGLFTNAFRVKRKISTTQKVSIIIPFKNEPEILKTCIKSLLTKTNYPNIEIILIDNQSSCMTTIDYCHHLTSTHENIFYYKFDYPFNYASLNNWAVQQVDSQYVLFLNNDIEIINPDWLDAMAEHIQRENVGAVGAKLLYPDNTIQHAGVVVSPIGAVHSNKSMKDGENGYFQRANYIQSVSVCTAACLLVKKDIFEAVNGFDEELFKVAYNDVDLCLKMREQGYLIIYTPYAKLYHHESKTRGFDTVPEKLGRFTTELGHYQNKWQEVYRHGDPYYNPNLRQTAEKISLNIK